MKKKTEDQYISELSVKNPYVELVGKYISLNAKTKHHCLRHDVYWETTPARALSGCGCEECRKEKFRKTRSRTHEEYVEQLKLSNPDIEIVDQFITISTPVKHHCLKHNIYWNATPYNVLHGCGCKLCGNEKIKNKLSKSNEQYLMDLKSKNIKDIIPLQEYEGANTPILHKCLIDEYEWMAKPGNILSGKGCPKCCGNLKRTHDEYIEEVKRINPNTEVIGKYINVKTPILHRCKIHKYLYLASPSSVLQGCECKYCGIEKNTKSRTKTHEEYISELALKNPNIIPIEEYKGADVVILHKCLIDGCEWMAKPGNILYGTGCPMCRNSHGEHKIKNWLDSKNINYISQKKFDDCRNIRPLPFDFYIPEKNVCIEYDGLQHFKSIDFFGGQDGLEYRVCNDNIKTEYCKNNGITLLRIPYYKNVEEELNNFSFI